MYDGLQLSSYGVELLLALVLRLSAGTDLRPSTPLLIWFELVIRSFEYSNVLSLNQQSVFLKSAPAANIVNPDGQANTKVDSRHVRAQVWTGVWTGERGRFCPTSSDARTTVCLQRTHRWWCSFRRQTRFPAFGNALATLRFSGGAMRLVLVLEIRATGNKAKEGKRCTPIPASIKQMGTRPSPGNSYRIGGSSRFSSHC